MSWRKFENHRQESKEVKKFLEGKGYQNVKAGHDRGTAWDWLRVKVSVSKPQGCYCILNQYGQTGRCDLCRAEYSRHYDWLNHEVMVFTGRTGDYGGRINYDINWI